MTRRLITSLVAAGIVGVLAAPAGTGIAGAGVDRDHGDDCSMSESGGGRWGGCNGVISAWRSMLLSAQGVEASGDAELLEPEPGEEALTRRIVVAVPA